MRVRLCNHRLGGACVAAVSREDGLKHPATQFQGSITCWEHCNIDYSATLYA